MLPGPTELRLIGYLIETIWTQKIPNQVHGHQKPTRRHAKPMEISHVMNGIIFCVCLTLAMSVLQFALIQWRSDLNNIQEKSESQQNRDQ